jgi:hypothetical protein
MGDLEITEAVDAQLTLLGIVADREPLLTALAFDLARTLDATSSARETPALARELRAVVDALAGRAEPRRAEVDPLDDLAARRAARSSSATGEVRPAAGGDTGP